MLGKWIRVVVPFVAITLACLVAAAPAAAEWFADLYLGGAFTEKHDIDVNLPGDFVTIEDVGFNKSFTGGIRGGYWFPFDLGPVNFGAGLDLSYFAPNISRQTTAFCERFCVSGQFDDLDLSVWVFGLDAMVRFPLLKSQEFPNGQLQPYLRVGPAIFLAHADDSRNFEPSNQDDTDASLGVKLGAGVQWLFTKNIGVFGEYRYTHFSPEFTFKDDVRGNAELSTSVNTHYLLVGVSFNF
jgi:opacity protein-like surface antigen